MPTEDDQTRSTPYLLGRIEQKLESYIANDEMASAEIIARLKAGDERFTRTDLRIERIERSVALLEKDRAEMQEARLERQKRALTRKDGVLIVSAGALLSALLTILSRIWDYVSIHIHVFR
ncbi:MAG: hypothetical protein ACYDHY_17485 [Acidiferrobacterales bacterium]